MAFLFQKKKKSRKKVKTFCCFCCKPVVDWILPAVKLLLTCCFIKKPAVTQMNTGGEPTWTY
jgi:hypothetical protein